MKFFCLHAEFYDFGSQKACVSDYQTNKKPKSQYRQVPGMTAMKIWLVSEKLANELMNGIRNKNSTLTIFLDFTPMSKIRRRHDR